MDAVRQRLQIALADRYTVEHEVGRGGMATVYLAEDLKHRRRVAIKVLDPDLAAAVGADRFLREIEIAANLTHPHILPVHDSGDADGLLYYVMPYVEGETLRHRLEREGPLPVEDALRITREVADALSFAHERGVLHRDVKPGNILLEAGHAVLADFGVAAAADDAGEERLTRTGTSVGSPAYMSPEQASGARELDGRSDVYALGCVLYEMLAGGVPYTGPSVQAVLAKKITEPLPGLRNVRDTVPEEVEEVARKALARMPADRYGTAKAFGEALGGASAITADAAATTGIPLWVKVAVPVALAGIALTVWMGPREPAVPPGAAAAAEVAERLVVLPLENLTEDPELDVLGRLAADQVARSIDEPQPVPVVPSSTVRDAYRQLGEDATTEQLARAVSATHAIAGTIAAAAGQLRMEIELIDVRVGERLRTFDPVTGPSDSAQALIERLAVQATAGAVVHLDPEAQQWMAQVSLPVSREAYEHFQRQNDLFCELDYTGSIEEGRRAVALSPEYTPVLILMGVALNNLGRDQEADSVFAILGGLRDRMTTIERLDYEWMMGNRSGDPAMATRAAEEAFRLDPKGHGLNAMYTAWRTNRMNDAVERYYATARPGGCIWRGTWRQGSIAFHALKRHEEELEVAREGLQYWPDDMGLMDVEIRAFAGLGRLDAVDSVLAVMASLPPQSAFDPALRPVYAALELRAHGYEAEADAMFADALESFASRTTSRSPYNLGSAYYYARRWSDAAPIFEELVEGSPENLDYMWAYGVTLAKLGDREGAQEVAARARAMEGIRPPLPYLSGLGIQAPGPNLNGAHIEVQAVITAALGDADEAIRLFQEAFDNGASHYVWIHRDPALDEMWGYAPFDSLMEPR